MRGSSCGLSFQNELQQRESRLVYKVHPLPEAMFSFVWDYGSLPKQEEKEYIQKILKSYSQ
jgi:hypothetical protein